MMAAASLQSQARRELLDVIDKLHARGISQHVDLPEIVVTGDQSAGKSSVLEAISGMAFPTGDNICTRFAIELILRRSHRVDVKVSIVPDADRPEREQEHLTMFSPGTDVTDSWLGDVIEEAKDFMGLDEPDKVFTKDVLRVEMSGPQQPHLTIVDLPGLFQADSSAESDRDSALVADMVLRYTKRPRSIVLAVVSAERQSSLQKVTQLARELDLTGVRTLGLITKPDTLDEGSESEAAYVKLAQSKDVESRLGWHVLKNRDRNTRDATSAERDEAEARLFSRSPWASIDPRHLGVSSLSPRLGNLLQDQILLHLPSLFADVYDGIDACKAELKRLGSPRASVRQQRRYLLETSQAFYRLMRAAVDGTYNDDFFGSPKTDQGYRRRLRAVVQNTLRAFSDTMHMKGHTRRIVDSHEDNQPLAPDEVLRTDFVEEITEMLSRSRGCELPGTLNPLVIGELFADQCRPWKAIAMELKEEIMQIVDDASQAMLFHVAAEETAAPILQAISSGIDELRIGLDAAFDQVLERYLRVHPITYDDTLVKTVHKVRADRRQRELEQRINSFLGARSLNSASVYRVSEAELSKLLLLEIEPDMEFFGSELAVDYMEAYYKISVKAFIDAISTLAIECSLLQKLPSVFDPEKIYDMSCEKISRLAVESETTALERKYHSEKLAVLETALDELKRLDSYRKRKVP
ncbi:hypothetical protein CDD83_8402 [Cordyceps sp. RAO-2017]|nr:hypothetical protein CDD83_8402 [Cordyceps sp. RAO-2017]